MSKENAPKRVKPDEGQAPSMEQLCLYSRQVAEDFEERESSYIRRMLSGILECMLYDEEDPPFRMVPTPFYGTQIKKHLRDLGYQVRELYVQEPDSEDMYDVIWVITRVADDK